MNPVHAAAVFAVEILPPGASDFWIGMVTFAAIVAALTLMVLPACLIVGGLSYWKERNEAREEQQRLERAMEKARRRDPHWTDQLR